MKGNDVKLMLGGREIVGFVDAAAAAAEIAYPSPFIEADIPLCHEYFLRVAARGDLHDVTDEGAIICRYMMATRDGGQRRGFAAIWSDCPGEV